ncbi:MAG: undecaprenyldiphospho-muramoylpentapeptide beta-N-acetylglucosaminyltransferase [Candidatus Omnitrophica bacterium]|nr:undecaprenyldiphospho-muramoylpentapeptide beta-N-acetylglucosaminyltransferase [Candidatus Omnitrophota bacterium]
MRALIASSATGGHLYPAISLSRSIKKRLPEAQLLFVINNKPLAISILKENNLPFERISAESVSFENPFRFTKGILSLALSFFESLLIVNSFRPDKVIAFGGYASFPIVLAAWIFRKPVIVHESNVIAGLANRACGFFADKVAVSFEKTKAYFKGRDVVVTGMPLREEFYAAAGEPFAKKEKDKLRILALGGSQGSHRINDSLIEALSMMNRNELDGLEVFHITGAADLNDAKSAYKDLGDNFKAEAFRGDIISLYKWADLIIARAGASTITEIVQFSKPSILVPYPYAGGHQTENAKILSAIGAAILISDGEFTSNRLKRELLDLENNKHMLSEMASKLKALPKPNGCENLTNLICGR